jgi:uncharacterized protein YkwD
MTHISRLFPIVLPLFSALSLSACVGVPVVVPIETAPRSFVAGYTYPDQPNPGVAPATARCATPARASSMSSSVVAQVNAQRKAAGLPALRPSAKLTKAAQSHACDNAARGSYSHVGSDGSDLGARIRRTGYKIRVAAENTGLGFDDPTRLVDFWMHSPGHRANILNPRVTEVGVGLADGTRPTWVLNLATRR